MIRRGGFHYPDVIFAATIEERNRIGVREAYYIAKNIKRDSEEFEERDFSEKEKIDAAFVVCNRIITEINISNNFDNLLKVYHKI